MQVESSGCILRGGKVRTTVNTTKTGGRNGGRHATTVKGVGLSKPRNVTVNLLQILMHVCFDHAQTKRTEFSR